MCSTGKVSHVLQDLGLELVVNDTPVDVLGELDTNEYTRDNYMHCPTGAYVGESRHTVTDKWAKQYRIHFRDGLTVTGQFPKELWVHGDNMSSDTNRELEDKLIAAIVSHVGPVNWVAAI